MVKASTIVEQTGEESKTTGGECTSTGKKQYYSGKLAMQVYDIFYVGTVSYTAGG
ncbi:hypothetical protein L3X09_14110 [Enterococcus faecium]|nr:hypothetical protein [Enterococcus faecium]